MTPRSPGGAGRPSSGGFRAKLVRLVGRDVAGRWLAVLRQKGRLPPELEQRTNGSGGVAAVNPEHKETS